MHNYEIKKLIEKVEKTNDSELMYFVKKLIRERDYLNELVNKDSLTGLNNRRVLDHIKNYSAVVMCDIDDYKKVNDIYGHSIGDTVIKNVSHILESSVKDVGFVCRYGGDEFIIVFTNYKEDMIYNKVENIRKTVESRLLLSNGERITLSFGIAINDKDTLKELINKADLALYKSKNSGKNQSKKYETSKRK